MSIPILGRNIHIATIMRRLWNLFTRSLEKVRKYVSPVFVMLLIASFTLWYIAKLNYTYTTELEVKVRIGDNRFEVPCVVEGKGTNLFGYAIYTFGRLNIPIEDLVYTELHEVRDVGSAPASTKRVHIQPASLLNAISVRLSDIKIRSVGDIPVIEIPKETKK